MGWFWFAYFIVSRVGRIGRRWERRHGSGAGVTRPEMAVITLFGLFIAVMGVGIMSAWVTRVNTGRDGGHGAWFQTDNMRSATASFIEIHPPSGTCSQFVEVEKMTAECRLASAAAMTRYERDRADGLAARAR